MTDPTDDELAPEGDVEFRDIGTHKDAVQADQPPPDPDAEDEAPE
jgi:hypothetical protein